VFKNIKSFVEFSDEIPFAKPIPRGESISLRRNSIPLELNKLGSRGLHIPRWLPRCPDERNSKPDIFLPHLSLKNVGNI